MIQRAKAIFSELGPSEEYDRLFRAQLFAFKDSVAVVYKGENLVGVMDSRYLCSLGEFFMKFGIERKNSPFVGPRLAGSIISSVPYQRLAYLHRLGYRSVEG